MPPGDLVLLRAIAASLESICPCAWGSGCESGNPTADLWGLEYRLPSNVKLRLGFKQARGTLASNEEKNSINLNPSYGAGIPLKIWKRQQIQLDYGLDPGNVGEGISHLFSFSMALK